MGQNNKNSKSRDIVGSVSLPANEFEPKNVTVRISILIPLDVIGAYKALAEKKGSKYQRLMNEALRAGIPELRSADYEKMFEALQQLRVDSDRIRKETNKIWEVLGSEKKVTPRGLKPLGKRPRQTRVQSSFGAKPPKRGRKSA